MRKFILTILLTIPSPLFAQMYPVRVHKEFCKAFNDNYTIAGYYREVMVQAIGLSATPELRAKNTNALRYMEKNCPYVL